MLGSTPPPEPKLWKALLVVALFAFPFVIAGMAATRWPIAVWIVVYVVIVFGVGGIIHKRIKRDHEATWIMNFGVADKMRSSLKKNE